MKKLIVLLSVFFVINTVFAYENDIYTTLDQLISETDHLTKELNQESITVKNMNEILTEIKGEESSDKYDLITELSEEISKLNTRDGRQDSLNYLKEINYTFDELINAVYSYDIDEVANISRSSYPTRGKISDKFDEVFSRENYEKIKGKIYNEILNLDVDFDIKLLDLNITEGIGLGSKYKWGLEPSYNDGFFTRIDAYRLGANVKIGDIIKDAFSASLPVYLNLSSENEIIFARQFKNQIKAASAIPYNPLALPINSKNALKMDIGDFVSIPSKLKLVAGASAGYTNVVNVSGNIYYVLSGEFRINILKMTQDKVRVKLVGMRKKGHGSGVNVGYKFGLFGISILDKQLDNLIGTKLLQFNHSDINGENFSVDYVFDLKDESARKAYNSFLNANLKFRVAETSNPFEDEEELKEGFFNNLVDAEKIFQEDLQKPANERRINRLFKASNFFDQETSNFKIGFNLIQFGWGKSYIENNVAVYNENNQIKNYFMPVLNVNSDSKFLFGAFKEKEHKNFYSLLNADTKWNITDMDSLAFTWSKRDKVCYAYEFKNLRKELFKSLGDIAEESGISQLRKNKEKSKSFKWNFKMIMGRDTVIQLLGQRSTEADFWEAFYYTCQAYDEKFWDTSNNENDDYFTVWTGKFSPAKKKVFKLFERNRWDYDKFRRISRIVDKLVEIFNNPSYNAKTKKFLELIKDRTFRDISLRYLIELAKAKNVHIDYKVTFDTRGNDMQTFKVNHGNYDLNETLYNELNKMIAHITDNSYDMFDVVESQYKE